MSVSCVWSLQDSGPFGQYFAAPYMPSIFEVSAASSRALHRILRRRRRDAELQQLERARVGGDELLALVRLRLLDRLAEILEIALVRLGVEKLRVLIDVGRVGQAGGASSRPSSRQSRD